MITPVCESNDAAIVSAVLQGWREVSVRPDTFILPAGNRFFALNHPIEVTTRMEEGVWVYTSKALGIEAFGEDRDEARRSFKEDFAVLYDYIAQADDSSLTPEARSVKRAFLDVVISVAEVITAA
jgi:hypothetical protein